MKKTSNKPQSDPAKKKVPKQNSVKKSSFGRGFGEKNLRRLVQFSEGFPDKEIVAALRRQLGWTHFKHMILIDDPLKRYPRRFLLDGSIA
jgi:hypothetical protein